MSRHSARGATWQAQRLRVLERDNWTCVYCHKPLQGADASIDHTRPLALADGHDYTDDELVAACRTCNSRKGARPTFRIDFHNPRYQ